MHRELQKLIQDLKELQLAVDLENLSEDELKHFANTLKAYPPPLIAKMRNQVQKKKEEPLLEENPPYERAKGELLPFSLPYKMGCILLAGGQATRLGAEMPKALFPISPFRKKTFLQIFCERVKTASDLLKEELPLAIMTSPLNHTAISSYLEKNSSFGLTKISLFSQKTLPFLDDNLHLLLEKPGTLAIGPDGNGEVLHNFYLSGIYEEWKKEGVQALSILPIDNPLADPFDQELAYAHRGEITLKAIERASLDEKVGIIGTYQTPQKEQKIKVQEYSEWQKDHARFHFAHIGLYQISLSFIPKAIQLPMPWHLARKKVTTIHGIQEVYKFETFIFDLLDRANQVNVLIYPREEVYAPLKTATGTKGVEAVQKAMIARDLLQYKKVTGIAKKNLSDELDLSFYYISK